MRLRVAAVCCLLAGASVGLPTVATAADSGCGTYGNYFDGATVDPNTTSYMNYSRAQIDIQAPALCSGV